MTKEEILRQLEKAGITDLDAFAEFLVRETSSEDESGQPVASDVIVVSHGFYHH
jgi:hypothetical protein